MANQQSVSTHHPAPDYRLTVAGRDITPGVDPRLINLSLTEARGNEADQLDLTLTDHDGDLVLPSKGALITLELGWVGQPMVDKGSFVVDEVEHTGAPDQISIRARAADMGKEMRRRDEKSWHDTTLGAIAGAIAARHKLVPRIDAQLGATPVAHIDQTNESDLHFLTRLARQHDAVATVKKGHLVFAPINGTKTSQGKDLTAMHITRAAGDQHRYHSAERNAYSGVRAYWHDPKTAQKRSVLAGTEATEKRLKDTYATEADALAAAQAEQQRVTRGKATFDLALALGRPELMPQTPVTVNGFKPEIDGTEWLVVKLTHSLGDQGLTTRLELETHAVPASEAGADDEGNEAQNEE